MKQDTGKFMARQKSKSTEQLLIEYEKLVEAQLNEEQWFRISSGPDASDLYIRNTSRIAEERGIIMYELRRRCDANEFSRHVKTAE